MKGETSSSLPPLSHSPTLSLLSPSSLPPLSHSPTLSLLSPSSLPPLSHSPTLSLPPALLASLTPTTLSLLSTNLLSSFSPTHLSSLSQPIRCYLSSVCVSPLYSTLLPSPLSLALPLSYLPLSYLPPHYLQFLPPIPFLSWSDGKIIWGVTLQWLF